MSEQHADLVRVFQAGRAVAHRYGHTYRGLVSNEVLSPHEALAAYDKAEHIDGDAS